MLRNAVLAENRANSASQSMRLRWSSPKCGCGAENGSRGNAAMVFGRGLGTLLLDCPRATGCLRPLLGRVVMLVYTGAYVT
uniref:Uncharacterized protein n=1 Tax=Arundo donax TaxID=35708 RepID=A0A0A9QNT9_ARUDO